MADPGTRGAKASRRFVAANAFWLVSDRVVGMVASAVVAVVLGRTLGPSDFGAYSASLSLVLVLSEVSEMGLRLLVPHDLLARGRTPRGDIVATTLRLRLVSALVVYVPAFALVWSLFLREHGGAMVAAVLASLILIRALEVHQYVHMAFEKGGVLAWARFVSTVCALAGIGAFVWSGTRSLLAAAVIDIARYLPFVLVLAWSTRRLVPRGAYDRDEARRLLRRAVPLTLPVLAVAVNMRVDQVMLGILDTNREVGVYAASARVSETVYFIPGVLVTALLPKLVAAKKEGEAAYDRLVVRTFSLMWFIGLLAAVAMFVSAGTLIPLVFGDEFRDGAGILRVLSLAVPFVFARGVLARWLVIEDQTRLAVLTTGSAAVINVLANLVLIPAHGGLGAAWATVLSWLVSGYLVLYLHPVTRVVSGQMNRGLAQLPATIWSEAGVVRRRLGARRA